jgi:hypothetical protein
MNVQLLAWPRLVQFWHGCVLSHFTLQGTLENKEVLDLTAYFRARHDVHDNCALSLRRPGLIGNWEPGEGLF